MILDEFAFEKKFRCFLGDNYIDTTCNKGKMEQRKLFEVKDLSFMSSLTQTMKE